MPLGKPDCHLPPRYLFLGWMVADFLSWVPPLLQSIFPAVAGVISWEHLLVCLPSVSPYWNSCLWFTGTLLSSFCQGAPAVPSSLPPSLLPLYSDCRVHFQQYWTLIHSCHFAWALLVLNALTLFFSFTLNWIPHHETGKPKGLYVLFCFPLLCFLLLFLQGPAPTPHSVHTFMYVLLLREKELMISLESSSIIGNI